MEKRCSCGIYAAKSEQHLSDIRYVRNEEVHGEVYLWGRVWDHELGYRAQFAYPKKLVLPWDIVSNPDELERLNSLIAYGVDIFIPAPTPDLADPFPLRQDIPLWAKASGYDQAGLDWITERHKWRCWRCARERNLNAGDKVSVGERYRATHHSHDACDTAHSHTGGSQA